MHRRLAELIEYADRQRAELLAAVDAIPESGRDVKVDASAWSVAEILEHLYRVETGIVRLLKRGVERARTGGAPLEQEDGSLLSSLDAPTDGADLCGMRAGAGTAAGAVHCGSRPRCAGGVTARSEGCGIRCQRPGAGSNKLPTPDDGCTHALSVDPVHGTT